MSSSARLTTRRSSNGFDLFAKSLACRLRRLRPELAARLQLEIQKLTTTFELEERQQEQQQQLEHVNQPRFGVSQCVLLFFFLLLHLATISLISLLFIKFFPRHQRDRVQGYFAGLKNLTIANLTSNLTISNLTDAASVIIDKPKKTCKKYYEAKK